MVETFPSAHKPRSRLVGVFVAILVALCFVSAAYYIYQTLEEGDSSGHRGAAVANQSGWYGDALDRWKPVATLGNAEIITSFALSPDGRYVAYVQGPTKNPMKPLRADHRLHLVSEDGSETHLVRAGSEELPITVEFSPDSSRLAAGFNSGRIAIWNVATGSLLAVNEDKREGIKSLTFADDNHAIFAACFAGEVWKFAPDLNGEIFYKTGEEDMQGRNISLRNGARELIVVGGYFKTVARAVNVEDGRLLRTFDRGARGNQFLHLEADLSADGRFLLSCSAGNNADIWDAVSATFLRTISVEGDLLGIESGTFSPDGNRVLFVGLFKLHLWDHINGRKKWDLEFSLVPDFSAYRPKPRFARNGKRFAAVWPRPDGRSNGIAIFEFQP